MTTRTRFSYELIVAVITLLVAALIAAPHANAQQSGHHIVFTEATTPSPGFVTRDVHEHLTKVYAAENSTFTLQVAAATNSGRPVPILPGTVRFVPQGAAITGFTVDPMDETRATFTTGASTGYAVNGVYVYLSIEGRHGEAKQIFTSMYVYCMTSPHEF